MKAALNISAREVAIGLTVLGLDCRHASYIAMVAGREYAEKSSGEVTLDGQFGKLSKDNQTQLKVTGKGEKVTATPAIMFARFGQKVAKDIEALKKEFGIEFPVIQSLSASGAKMPALALEWYEDNKAVSFKRLIADCDGHAHLAEKRKALEAELAAV